MPPDDGTNWEAEARRLEEEQQRRQEEQRRQIEEQARRDQEDYERIAEERAIAARANQLASTYNDPTAGGTIDQPLPPQAQPTAPAAPASFGDMANSLITQTFGPPRQPMPETASESERYVYRGAEQQPTPLPPPMRSDVPYDPDTHQTGPLPTDAAETMSDRRPLSFADQANSLITGAFGPESPIGSAVSGAYQTAVRGGMPDVVDIVRKGDASARETIDTYGAGAFSRDMQREQDLQAEQNRFLESQGKTPTAAQQFGQGEVDPDFAAANPERAEELRRVRDENLMTVGGMAGTGAGKGLAQDAVDAIKALRAAGVADDVILAAERNLAEGADMALSAVQKLTRGAQQALPESPSIPKPPLEAPTSPQPGDTIRLPDGTRARVDETDLAPSVFEPPRAPAVESAAGPQVGERVRLPDGTRATVTEGGGAPPTGRPPAPPTGGPPSPPEGGRQLPLSGFPEPPPEDLTHVRGFGILQGVDPVGREALERAAAKGRQFPQGVPRADPTEAAVRLGMTPDEVAAKWLRQDTREASDEVNVLRQGVAASLDDLQEAARKARDGTLSAGEQQAAVDSLVDAAVGGEFLRAGRRAAESAGRALNQFRSAVQVQAARNVYDAMERAAQAATRGRVVLNGIKNGKVPNEAGLRQLEQLAADMDGAAGRDLLGEGGEAVRRRARRNAGLPEPPTGAAPEGAAAGAGAPKEPSFAERWGQLKRAHTAAEEAGDTARMQDISDQISALSAEVRADAIDRARKAVEETKKPLTMEEAQRIVDERLGQGAVSRIRREEMDAAKGFTAGKLQADLDKDVQRKVLAALRRAEAQQDALMQSLNVQTQRGIEKAFAAEKRAEIKSQAREMAAKAKQWMDRAKRDPENMAFRDEFDQQLREMSEHSNVGEVLANDLREQFATHLDEHAFQFMGDVERRVAGAEREAITAERAGIEKEALQGMAQRLRDAVATIRQYPDHPGLSDEVDRLMADMTAVSQRGFEMSSDIKKSLTKAGLQRFAGKLSEDQVEQFTQMLRSIDPDDPRALGNVMAFMRRGHWLDRLREYSIANMLSSTATASPLGINNIANTLSTVAHYGFKLPAMATTESVRTLGGLRGTPEVAWGDVGAAYRAAAGAFGPAVQDAVQIMKHGSTTRQAERAAQLADFSGSHPELMTERPKSLMDVASGKWGPVGTLLHALSTRQLQASDAFWSTILESGNYAALAARKARKTGVKVENILANPLDHMDVLEEAGRMSKYTLLKQRSSGSRVLGALITPSPDASMKERIGKFAAQQIIPFTTTPLNSVLQLVEYSPGGALVQGGRAAFEKDGLKRAELTSTALAGATLAGIGIAGIQSPVPRAPGPEWTWITGAAPIDTEKRKALQAQGWQENSVWNPVNRTYNSLMGTPMAPVLFPAWSLQGFADAVEKGERKGTAKEWEDWLEQGLAGAAQRTVGAVIDQSMMRSVGDITEAFRPEGSPARLGAGIASRYIPFGGLVAQLSRLGDAVQRDPKTVLERVGERLPIRGYVLPERQGPLGEALPNDMGGSLVNSALGLVTPSPRRTAEHSNPTYQAFREAGVDIGAPIDRLALKRGAGVPLTPEEQRRWATYRGEVLAKNTAAVMADASWARWSPYERQIVLQRVLARAGDEATGRMLQEMDDRTLQARMVPAGQR